MSRHLGLPWLLAIVLVGPGRAETLQPEFLFEIPSIADEYLIGVVRDVALGPGGEICLLDQQLLDVKIFDAEGNFLRTIARGGEGPGELSEPGALIVLEDGRLLVPCRMPRRLVTMDLQGLPGPEFGRPAELSVETGFLFFVGRCGAHVLAREDERDRDGNHETIRYRWIAFAENDAQAQVLGESSVERRLGEHTVYTEASFPFGRFAAHAEGNIFLATERERYRIERFDAQLHSVGWIERDYPVHRKSDEELREERDRLQEWVRGSSDVSLPDVLKTKPSIASMIARPNGWLFVRNGRAVDEARASGIVGAYDVFDGEGGFAGSIEFDLPFDYEHDQLQWTDRQLVVIRNGLDAHRAGQAQFLAEEEREKALSGDWEQTIEFYAIPAQMPSEPSGER